MWAGGGRGLWRGLGVLGRGFGELVNCGWCALLLGGGGSQRRGLWREQRLREEVGRRG